MPRHLVHDSSLPQQLVEGSHIVVHCSDVQLQHAGAGLSTMGAASHSWPAHAGGSLKVHALLGGEASPLDVVRSSNSWHAHQAEPDGRSAWWGVQALCSFATDHFTRHV